MSPVSQSDTLFSQKWLKGFFFLIFCMKLNTDNGLKVMKPDFGKKFRESIDWAKRGQKLSFSGVSQKLASGFGSFLDGK